MGSGAAIRIDDLRVGLLAILADVERKFGSQIDLDADYYWHIPTEAAFDMGSNPVPDVGQLSDDIEELARMLPPRADGEVIIWHDLDHVIGILQRLAALDSPRS